MDDVINQLQAEFGGKTEKFSKSDTHAQTIDDILNDFGGGKKQQQPNKIERLYVSPSPPMAAQRDYPNGPPSVIKQATDTKEAPDVEALPITSVGSSIAKNFTGARELAGEGLQDLQSGHPYKGAAKTLAGGALMGLSPLSGLIEGGIERPVTELTGNPDVGSRAGFVASSALPVKIPYLKTIANPAKPINKIPEKKAFDTLIKHIEPENAGYVAREMRADPRLTPADLSPSVLQEAQKLFVTEGPKAKNYIANYTKDSVNTAKEAVENAFTGAMGATVNPAEKIKELANNIKTVGAKEINPVLKATKPVDLTPVVEHIDNILKPGVTHVISNPESMLPYDKVQKLMESWRGQLTNDKTVLTNPDVLNKIQSGMRRQAEQLMRTPDAESKAMGYALYGLRNKIIEAIGKAGPQTVDAEGKAISAYRKGLSKYKDENDIASAFEHGHDAIIKNSKNLEDHPSFFKNWVNRATDAEKEAAKEGAKVAIDTQINGFKSAARRGTDIGQSEFNRQRIEALFGKEEADKLFKKLENERMIAERNSALVKGSQTAMRTQAGTSVAMPTIKEVGKGMVAAAMMEAGNVLAHGTPGVGTGLLVGAKIGNVAKHAIMTKLAQEHNAHFAKLALPTEGPSREALIQSLEAVANRQKPSLMSRATRAARLIAP